jgi:hypothetical protein
METNKAHMFSDKELRSLQMVLLEMLTSKARTVAALAGKLKSAHILPGFFLAPRLEEFGRNPRKNPGA